MASGTIATILAMPSVNAHNFVPAGAIRLEEIAGYKLLRRLGAGGFAQTFLAEKDGKHFALKLFHELPSGEAAVRFEREIEALKLDHTNLVRYIDSGISSYGGLTRAFIVMPFVPGKTLREAIDGAQPLSAAELRRIVAEIADGLAFLHEHNVTHRDLTPKNVFLTDEGKVLILDFGLARMHDRSTLTLNGQWLGTLAYCAPEQLRNETDLHADLYGLGATLYDALTGRPPFVADNVMALMEMIGGEDPEPPSAHNPAVPEDLDELVLALLAKEPVQRPASAEDVAKTLRAPRGERRAKPDPHDRNSPPRLAIRATSSSAARAILDAAMTGATPDLALGPVTKPEVLDELGRAAAFDPSLLIAVDTKVETTARIDMPKSVRERAYAPVDGTPYRHQSLRDPACAKRVARGDLAEQLAEGATVFRTPCFPFDSPDDQWIKRDARLLGDSRHARDAIDAEALLLAMVRCDIDALAAGRDARVSIANRFVREMPNGYWIEIPGLMAHSKPAAIAAAFDLFLLLQERGVPAFAALPGSLVELAWSVGIAGVEVKLGRVGGTGADTVRTPTNAAQPPRFEFPSIFAALPPDEAILLLAGQVLPESECNCPSCRIAGTPAARVAAAEPHDLRTWLKLRDELIGLDIAQRVERLRVRLSDAEAHLGAARRAMPQSNRFNSRAVRGLAETLDLLEKSGALAPVGVLRRTG